MKTHVSIFLFLTLGLSCQLLAQNQWNKKQQAAQNVLINMFEAISERDSVGFKNSCTADVTFYEYGQVWNLDTLINKTIRQNTAADFKRVNTFSFIQTTTDKNQAWLTYRLTSTITKGGKESIIEWLETAILAKEEKRWKVKHLHSTRINRN